MQVGTEQAHGAVAARDTRFDGCFVHAVRTTGIYCRPSCPARTPHPANSTFFPSAAAAQAAGYRACRRCLPDAVPGSPEWNLRSDLAARAMRLINDGMLDRAGVAGLATALGYSSRQLTRVLTDELGAGPLGLARSHRAHTARTLIETTALPFTEVAFAAGFASLRQFNDTVRDVFATTPTALRGRARHHSAPSSAGAINLRLPLRTPYDTAGIFAFLQERAIPGLEDAGPAHYSRSLRLPHGTGVATVHPRETHLSCTLRLADLRDLSSAVGRLRRLFDLDADPRAVSDVLTADATLAPAARHRSGIRLPGSVDGAETLLRAVLGQRISVAAARTAGHRLVDALGEPLPHAPGSAESVTRLFPDPRAVAEDDTVRLGVTRQQSATLRALAAALDRGELRAHPGCTVEQLRADLLKHNGVGEWTADYVTMRVLAAPDVLLSGDRALRRGAARLGLPTQPAELLAHSQDWRPWRSYATTLLWRIASSKEEPPCIGPQ